MIDDPDCPVCGAASWREIGSSTYTSGQAAGAKGWKKTAYRTLFEVWVPGEDRFTVRYRLCGDCGLVPVPEDQLPVEFRDLQLHDFRDRLEVAHPHGVISSNHDAIGADHIDQIFKRGNRMNDRVEIHLL